MSATTHKATQDLGPCVVDGRLVWASASIISAGDPRQDGGCPRRWHFYHVAGLPEPETAAQSAGTRMHAEIEHYLKTGEKTLGQLALSGARFIPAPGPGLRVEHSILTVPNDHTSAKLVIAGVPIAGHVDLVNERGRYLDHDGDLQADVPGTVEINDWKSTASFEWAKSGPKLRETVQMPLYGAWGLVEFPDAPGARLSHVYFRTKGAAASQKSTIWCSREEIGRRLEGIAGVVRSLVDVAKIPAVDSNKVEANERACPAFRGCPRAKDGSCSVLRDKTVAQLLGRRSAMALADVLTPGVLAPAPAAPVATLSMLEQLELEEAALIAAKPAKPATPPPAAAAPALPPGFVDACKAIEAAGMGFPTMSADAAAFRAVMNGTPITPGAGLAGSDKLARVNIRTAAETIQLASEVTALKAKRDAAAAPAPAAVAPPDAPASDPALAALPVEGFPPAAAPAPAAVELPATPAPIAETVAAAATVAVEATPAKRRPGRPRRTETTVTDRAGELSHSVKTITDAHDGDGFDLYVNAIPSTPYESLDRYIAALCEALCKRYACADVRCAPKDSPLAFGSWKGVVAAMARSAPPPDGAYVIHTASEIHEVVADALSGAATVFVRGVR